MIRTGILWIALVLAQSQVPYFVRYTRVYDVGLLNRNMDQLSDCCAVIQYACFFFYPITLPLRNEF